MKLGVYTKIIFVCVNIACSSSRNKDKDNEPQAPVELHQPPQQAQALSLTGFAWESFQQVPWESNCEGIAQFFQDFAKQYLPGASLAADSRSCHAWPTSDGNFRYEYRFKYIKPEKELTLLAVFTQDPNKVEAEINRVSDSISTYIYSSEDSLVGENLRNIEKSMEQWVAPQTQEKTFLGRPYSQFLKEFHERFQSEGGGVLKDNPLVKIRISPSADNKTSGSLEFIDLADAYFRADSSPSNGPSFLGCPDLKCVQSKKFDYIISGPRLTVYPAEGETVNGVTAKPYWYEDIKRWY
ncbi:MAG: hypothetical protein M3Q07_21655 [Pseudobdellovibrionaceae bacterium]|nr:hypothetical protein [Pseudobdellovibrionaceae bacterium]